MNPEVFQIDGVDIDAAVQYYSGDEEGFVELLELYCIDGKRKTKLLRELMEADSPRYQIEVHGLKSASANIGAMDVSAMARAQENAAAQGDREFIVKEFPLFLAEYETLLENIAQFLKRRSQENNRREKLPCMSIQQLREQTEAALNELKHFQSTQCAERVETMLLHQLPNDIEESLLQIGEQLRLYEDDYAEELLAQLLDILEKEEE